MHNYDLLSYYLDTILEELINKGEGILKNKKQYCLLDTELLQNIYIQFLLYDCCHLNPSLICLIEIPVSFDKSICNNKMSLLWLQENFCIWN